MFPRGKTETMKNHILILVVAWVVISCKAPEAPSFRRVENVQIDVVGKDEVKIEGDAIFYNPNTARVKIKNVDLDVAVENHKVASMNKEYDIKVEGLKEFTVPLDVRVSMADLNMDLINTALMLISGKKKKVSYNGEVTISVYGFNYTVPVDYEDEVRIQL